MGRLIDAGELMTRIRLNYNNHQIINAGAIKDIIDTTRTAYDVEKVVAELEDGLNDAKNHWDEDDYYTGKANAYEGAIEIVRKGGNDG